jgi:23S rRNA pseudouridine1911/1915/1917 synthase
MNIIYEEEDFLVLNKPSGLVVHPDDNYDKNETLIGKLLEIRPEIEKVGEDKDRPGIVHRLDKGTSGVLVVAKTDPVFRELKELFKKRKVEKTYIALVHGKVAPAEGEIDYPIYLSPDHFPKREALQDESQKEKIKTKLRKAFTRFETKERFEHYTLLRVYPRTGRTHQIRVHLQALGYPVVGDELYQFKNQKSPEGLERIFLHAQEISFKLKGRLYSFEADLSEELADFLTTLS